MSEHLDGLNKRQRKAVLHGENILPTPSKAALIIAGAGTGKTSVIVARVVELLMGGVLPGAMLLLTYTHRAAEEIERRVGKAIFKATGQRDVRLPWAGTFHAVGYRLIREYSEQPGLKSAVSVIDESDSADLMDLVRSDVGLPGKDEHFPSKDTCSKIKSYAMNAVLPLGRVLKCRFPGMRRWKREMKVLLAAYAAEKAERGILDYDDLLQQFLALLQGPVRDELAARFQHVLVDEYQDTNALQARILTALKPDGRGLFVVGDDAQAIYSFRAATVENIIGFPDLFDGNVRVLKLEKNYRSTQSVLDACNAVLGLSTKAFPKRLQSDGKAGPRPKFVSVKDERAQARYVTRRIARATKEGVPLREQAVLIRARSQSYALEGELAKLGIPFEKWGGAKFSEAAHIKDAMSVLRWIENPGDRIAASRALLLLPGVGKTTAAEIFDAAQRGPLPRSLSKVQVPIRVDRRQWSAFCALVAVAEKEAWPNDVASVVEWYEPICADKYRDDDSDGRKEDLQQLIGLAAAHPTRQEFLAALAIEPPEVRNKSSVQHDREEDRLVISTIHSAKGQEWTNVTILNVVDGCIPSSRASDEDALEEERRLFYVAMTRAKINLELIVPSRLYSRGANFRGDRSLLSRPTPFIPKRIQKYFKTTNK
jgi:DNA helicase-2/ATP-dependent DNA helicase PcrA